MPDLTADNNWTASILDGSCGICPCPSSSGPSSSSSSSSSSAAPLSTCGCCVGTDPSTALITFAGVTFGTTCVTCGGKTYKALHDTGVTNRSFCCDKFTCQYIGVRATNPSMFISEWSAGCGSRIQTLGAGGYFPTLTCTAGTLTLTYGTTFSRTGGSGLSYPILVFSGTASAAGVACAGGTVTMTNDLGALGCVAGPSGIAGDILSYTAGNGGTATITFGGCV